MSDTAVDPGLQTLLDQIAALGGPGVETLEPGDAREQYTAMALLGGDPEDVASVDDGEVAGVPVRTYEPAGGDAVGTLIWFHGGGWVIGDLDTADRTARQLANRAGCTVVSVDYRRAPEHRFPAAVDDCWAVTQALAAPGGALAVGGDSAGGNLAAVVALRARDAGIALRHQLLVYPVTDVSQEHPSYVANGDGYLLTAGTMRWFAGHYVGDDPAARSHPDASPLLATDLAGVAPAHVLTAGYDPLRDEGDAYAARLAEAGVPVVHDRHPAMIHGFFALGMLTPAAGAAVDRAAAHLRESLRAQ